VVGALLGWLLGLFDLMDPLVTAVWLALNGVVLGAVIGVVVGLLGYALIRGSGDSRPPAECAPNATT
jgi:hypothetical protein